MALLRMYAITAIILTLKMSSLAIVQGRGRVKAGIFVNPEDARTFGAKVAPEEVPIVQRAAKAWRNDLENIPIFLILAWIYVSAGLSTTPFVIYCIVFMVGPNRSHHLLPQLDPADADDFLHRRCNRDGGADNQSSRRSGVRLAHLWGNLCARQPGSLTPDAKGGTRHGRKSCCRLGKGRYERCDSTVKQD